MRRIMKWGGIALLGVVVLLVAGVGYTYANTALRMNKSYEVTAGVVPISTDPGVIEHGRRIVATRGCWHCHGADFSGGTLLEDPMIGSIYGTNLTRGQGGIGATYSDADWVKAIRHGIRPNGKPLVIMPAGEFYYLSDGDLGAMISFLKSLPAVDNSTPAQKFGPLGRVFTALGMLSAFPAEDLDHGAPRPPAPPPDVTVAYGEYMAKTSCTGCHGVGLSGGPIPGGPPADVVPANLTPGGNLANWTEAGFIRAMRTGLTPEGKQMKTEEMPWADIAQMTDEELQALWLYLESLPSRATGNR